MRKLSVFVTGLLFGVAAFAENPLDCVDPDVLRGLVFRGNVEQVVSTELPEEITDLNIPAGFSWIGRLERNLGSGISPLTTVTAAFRTGLAPEAARVAALDALTADGWTLQPGQQGMGMGVFTSANDPIGQTACRDNLPITVTTNVLDGTTYVIYGISRGGVGNACDRRMRPALLGASGLEAYLPTLELPTDPVTGAPPQMQGGGGGSGSSGFEVRTEFELDDTAGNVARHFARQLTDQGWTPDATWSGNTTAGSAWSIQPNADTRLLGTLHVTAVDDGQFNVTLHVVKL